VLLHDDVTVFRCELWVPFATPLASSKVVTVHDRALRRAGVTPILIITGLPPTVWNDNNLHAGAANGSVDGAKIVNEPDLLRDFLDARPDLAAFGKEVVLGINKQERSGFLAIAWLGHAVVSNEFASTRDA
jgi:hypothetical protein